jgi:hypothetical protein
MSLLLLLLLLLLLSRIIFYMQLHSFLYLHACRSESGRGVSAVLIDYGWNESITAPRNYSGTNLGVADDSLRLSIGNNNNNNNNGNNGNASHNASDALPSDIDLIRPKSTPPIMGNRRNGPPQPLLRPKIRFSVDAGAAAEPRHEKLPRSR